jgi:hypothetical protein
MPKKTMTYLELCEMYSETGRLDRMGLEASIQDKLSAEDFKAFETVQPTFLEAEKHAKNEDNQVYWDAEPFNEFTETGQADLYHEFGPLRLTILLLCAAINGELNEESESLKSASLVAAA